ncbi:MAG: tetratricopeptide repeat protein [Balneolaceae bacterium]
MTTHSLTRIASLLLAFGFFFGCSVISPKSTTDDGEGLTSKDIENRLDRIQRDLQSNPGEPDLLIEQLQLLRELAQRKSAPDERTPIYRELRSSADELKSIETETETDDTLNRVLNISWSSEHNRGVELMQRDSSGNEARYTEAAAHFENAITILPDSLVSYEMKARSHYYDDDAPQAIQTLNRALEHTSSPSSELLEQLAFLHLENRNSDEAIRIYEEIESFESDNLNLLHGLANAYISGGQHAEAILLLEQLVEQQPNNVAYRETLGIELFHQAAGKMDSLITAYNDNDTPSRVLREEPAELLDRAEHHLREARTLNEGPAADRALANFYHNSAAKYRELLSVLPENEQEQVEDRVNDYLNGAIPLFEDLTSVEPSNTVIWQNLYQAYSYLGMDEEAQEARTQLNQQ